MTGRTTVVVTVPSRVAVSFGPVHPGRGARPGTAAPAGRVTAPGRVLRLWSVLNAATGEFRAADLSPRARARLYRTLRAVSGDLAQCVSPPLAAELASLLPRGGAAPEGSGPGEPVPGASELRVEYALVLGWLGGLVIGMLDELEMAAGQERRHSHEAQGQARGPARGRPGNPG